MLQHARKDGRETWDAHAQLHDSLCLCARVMEITDIGAFVV